jgi:predicted DNA binding CopG/RHH family protein
MKKPKEYKTVTVKVPNKLYRKWKHKLAENGLTWQRVLVEMLEAS